MSEIDWKHYPDGHRMEFHSWNSNYKDVPITWACSPLSRRIERNVLTF